MAKAKLTATEKLERQLAKIMRDRRLPLAKVLRSVLDVTIQRGAPRDVSFRIESAMQAAYDNDVKKLLAKYGK